MGQEWEIIAADESLTAVEKLRRTLGMFGAQFDAMVDFFGVGLGPGFDNHTKKIHHGIE